MAASAYAGVVSLMHVLDNVQHPARPQLQFDRNQIETLREGVSFFEDFLKVHSEILCSTDKKDLARQIADVADEAEHLIDSHVVDQLSQPSADKADTGPSSFSEDMNRVANKFEDIKKALMIVKEGILVQEQQPGVSLRGAASSASPSSGKTTMVGFDGHFVQILEKVKGRESRLQIIPIVGMGGIGKTTLARNIYQNPLIEQYFDVRAWVTISQEYSIHGILMGLLEQDGTHGLAQLSFEKLKEKLYNRLYWKRYLIVMDDMWNTQVWDDLQRFFPDNNNRSRIIVTTRFSNVAYSIGYLNFHWMDFLDEDKSWNLFCKKVFGEEDCPPELEEIGKKIAEGCKGLPLAIVTIGDLLANSNMKLEYWEFVAENVNSFVNSRDDGSFLNTWLSYNNLPIHLKPCFLYMRIFPGHCEIRVSKLIRSWVAEGFVTPRGARTLEEVAYEYLQALIESNLILICQLTYSGKIKTCMITDLLRDLCLKEHEKEGFFRVSKVQVAKVTEKNLCFLCSHQNASTRIYLPQVLVASQPTSLGRCFVCDVCLTLYSLFDRLRLVRAICRHNRSYSVEFLQSTLLRYLDVGVGYQLVSTSLHLLWNLQTLIITDAEDAIKLPSEIWEMPQLRHVKISPMAILPDPPEESDSHQHFIILESLQTLSFIENFRCLEEILERIPNLKKLVISCLRRDDYWSYYELSNLSNLQKLESLSLHFNGSHLEEEIKFPQSLRRLCLDGCHICWEGMPIIGELPNLEVLKLISNSGGPEWNATDEKFPQLKAFIISDCDLVRWNAENVPFPGLEILVLREMHYLEEIPSGIGDIPTLQSIRVVRCTQSVVESAKAIIEEQLDLGNEDLRLHVEDCDPE